MKKSESFPPGSALPHSNMSIVIVKSSLMLEICVVQDVNKPIVFHAQVSAQLRDAIGHKNLSPNGSIKTPLYRLIELRLTFGYRLGRVFTQAEITQAPVTWSSQNQ